MTTPNFTVSADGTNGTATINATTGAWSYTPNPDSNEDDTFTVTITDDDGHQETQDINITVNAVNDDATFGGDTTGTGNEDGGAIAGTLTATDDIDGLTTPNFTVSADARNATPPNHPTT